MEQLHFSFDAEAARADASCDRAFRAFGSSVSAATPPGRRSLASAVAQSYALTPDRPLDNERLYRTVERLGAASAGDMAERSPVGARGEKHSLLKRECRWVQQTMRQLGLLERDSTGRGVWQLSERAKKQLTPAAPKVAMLGFCTDLGIAVWGACNDVFSRLDDEITCVVTSPPYPLRTPRAYGGPTQAEYVDFICRVLEPLVRKLRRGGTIALNISNDIFEDGSPARSLYRERLVIALFERLGLHKLDELIWVNWSKPPGPIAWASKKRMQLNTAWEPVYILTNDPNASVADNRRVLQPHTKEHLHLIRRGGEARTASYSDGAYTVRPGRYAASTAGKIPRNVLEIGGHCADQRATKRAAREAGLPEHGAPYPLALATFLIEWLSAPGDLVADPFCGSFTTAKAAEQTGRRWIGSELFAEYVAGSAARFPNARRTMAD